MKVRCDMGRTRFNEDRKEVLYKEMYKVLKDANRRSDNLKAFGKTKEDCSTASEKRELEGYMLADELLEAVNENMATIEQFNRSQMSAALQHGRRQLENKRIKVVQWIMASPQGLFLPKGWDDERIYAYAVSNLKEINSRARTQNPLFFELMRLDPEKLKKKILEANSDWDIGSDEMQPWGVWAKLTDQNYREFAEMEPAYRDDDYWR